MVDTARNQDAFLNSSTGLLRTGVTDGIRAQSLRDFVLTAFGASFPRAVATTATAAAR